ncbi:MAG: nuclear transport factor 2 family protein [Phycisphaerales bacterium]|nr:MAG: nuclear transport factor 2 family protein [Phycisphaerales bacterium]
MPPKTPEEFITAYEAALASQDWAVVEPLVHPDACVTFSNGSVHEGRPAVQAAFTRNFSLIKSEQYSISNVRWVRRSDDFAVYLFDFSWQGVIDGEPASGAGRGTCTIVREHDHWQLLIEHLGPRSP